MTVLAFSGYWIVGWVIGAAVVVVAAALILIIARIARRIELQAEAITKALDGTRANTEPLWAVKQTNHAVDRITRGLRRVRTGQP